MTTPGTVTTPPPTVRRWRSAAIWTVVVVAAALALALVTQTRQATVLPLDPDNAGPQGTRALAEVLRDHGVTVDVVRSTVRFVQSEVPGGASVVIGDLTSLPEQLVEHVMETATDADRIVLLDPAQQVLDGLGIPASAYPARRAPDPQDCGLGVLHDGDVISRASRQYTTTAPGATVCLHHDDDASAGLLVRLPATAARPEIDLVGFSAALTNDEITTDANAGVALRLLGATDHVVWVVPLPTDAAMAGATTTANTGWPRWVGPGLALVGLGIVLLALVRGRRLGRVVVEPLPVVVRAIESTEARARLYRRARDRQRAAAILRRATTNRLMARLGVDRHAEAHAVVDAVARAAGSSATEAAQLLAGPAPATDEELIDLAQKLSALETKVRQT